ncbi:MAG: hypothetical protein HOE90_09710 [Bacteriovoracaceae bacterium]|nr:hypothetical protein [Bacteriovoracaceae bacterium]
MSVSRETLETYWPKIKKLAETEGAQSVISLCEEEKDFNMRWSLYRFSNQTLAQRDWSGRDLNTAITVGEAGIESMLKIASSDSEIEKTYKDRANILCYNLGANLCDCWDDGIERNDTFFEKGVELACRAIKLREELDKGPAPFSMAYWLRGKHYLSLKQVPQAKEDLKKSLDYAKEDARTKSQPDSLCVDAGFAVILGFGLVAIAEIMEGTPGAQDNFDQVISVFENQISQDSDKKADAEFGIFQLKESLPKSI